MTDATSLSPSPAGATPDIGPKPEMAPTSQSAPVAPAADPYAFEPEDYGASVLRTTIFCLVFLLLLPFFASLPAMIGMRASAGLLGDNLGLLVLAAVFTALMFLVFVEMMFSIRTRVHLGREKVRMTLPAGRGPTPMLRYRSYEFPYDQVDTVETRREIYGGAMTPVLMKGARVILKDGTLVPLGYVSEADADPVFPYDEIARKIADRARLPLIDRGAVRRSVRSKMMGIKATDSENTIIDEAGIARLNASHNTFMLALIGIVLILMLIGIVQDFADGSPIGQTAALPTVLAAIS
ncbi:MAG: hypothetical protein C0519_04350 [Hyphomicrobium sp.]|nr:hypothetical protein [Hyphomicrobium sp.]PPD07752.1 MAG: hypothetical protein CTY28_07870 [Hyphomicrobium sp.]